MVFVNPHFWYGSLTSTGLLEAPMVQNELNVVDKITLTIGNALRELGVWVEKGAVKIKILTTKKVISERLITKRLCIKDTCLDKNQLKALLEGP
jgi:hypothetical protein